MKKIISVICLLSVAAVALIACSCSQKEGDKSTDGETVYTALIYDYSDTATAAKREIEYEFADLAKYEKLEPAAQLELTIDGKQRSGVLEETQYRGCNYYPLHRYRDSDGFTFEVDESNVLMSCFWKTSDVASVLSEEVCKNAAIDFMNDIIDVSQYTVSVTKDDDKQRYTVEFCKYNGNIRTTDCARVVVQYNGELYSYSSFMLGRVPAFNIGSVDMNNITAPVYTRLDSMYKDVKADYSAIEYGEPLVELTALKDGTAAYICTIDVRCINNFGAYDGVTTERLSFVVKAD